jgi:iron complex outermembrane receptor protein
MVTGGVAHAEPDAPDEASVQEKVIITGSRGKARSVMDSPVPVDVLSGDEINDVPFTDANDILKTLVPSYSLSRQPISDGGTFIRPATLRGMPTDKTLVLVNSKRRHRAALVQIGGSGTQGPDVATIPAIALKSVEVLRDGAAAQYGSDAIAGVINFILKDSPEGGSFSADFGQYYEGDGFNSTSRQNFQMPTRLCVRCPIAKAGCVPTRPIRPFRARSIRPSRAIPTTPSSQVFLLLTIVAPGSSNPGGSRPPRRSGLL